MLTRYEASEVESHRLQYSDIILSTFIMLHFKKFCKPPCDEKGTVKDLEGRRDSSVGCHLNLNIWKISLNYYLGTVHLAWTIKVFFLSVQCGN